LRLERVRSLLLAFRPLLLRVLHDRAWQRMRLRLVLRRLQALRALRRLRVRRQLILRRTQLARRLQLRSLPRLHQRLLLLLLLRGLA
jgi:hypothetical protein